MSGRVARAARLAAACAFLAPPAGAVEVSPILGLQVLAGQNFYGGQKSGLAGNASGVVAPAMKLDERWAVLPSLHSVYQGTEQALDVVGGGTLFQEQWDTRLQIKAVYTPAASDWRLKPYLGYKYELLKETKNERWGKGLFDYAQRELGFDAEYLWRDPFGLKLGADYYETTFANYTTLESQAATSFQGRSLARELVGDHILDTQNFLFTASGEAPIRGRFVAEGGLLFLYERFGKQHVVDAAGNLTEPLRADLVTVLSAGVRRPAENGTDLRSVASFEASLTLDSSNQNSYDATRALFLPSFYDYSEVKLGPAYQIFKGPAKRPVAASLAATWWHRHYPRRSTQDSAGNYLGSRIDVDNWTLAASLSWPMAERFSLVFSAQHGRASSNQHFEQFYRYNYTASNYLFGFSYDY